MSYTVRTWWDDGEGYYREEFETFDAFEDARARFCDIDLPSMYSERFASGPDDGVATSEVFKSIYESDEFGDYKREKSGIAWWSLPDLMLESYNGEKVEA